MTNRELKRLFNRFMESLEIHSEANNLIPLRVKLHKQEVAGVKYIDWQFFELSHPAGGWRKITIYTGNGDFELIGEEWTHIPFSIKTRSADIVYEAAYEWIVNGVKPNQP